MFLTVKLVLKVTSSITDALFAYERSMKHEIYQIAGVFKKRQKEFEFRYKHISNEISWYSKSIVLEQAKLLYRSECKGKPKKLNFSSIWSELSYDVRKEGIIALELGAAKHREKLLVPFYVHEHQMERIEKGTLKEMTIRHTKHTWVAFVLVDVLEDKPKGDLLMGLDLGMKVPAVACVSDGSVCFFGSGREIRFYQRCYRKKIQMMQKQRQYKKLRNFSHRLSRILKNFDHQISAEVISYAVAHNVGCIKMERLTNIREQFKVEITSNIYLWSYRRLQEYIAYKAKLSGIRVMYVKAYNTSKRCPKCGTLNTAKDRFYLCKHCRYHGHRDLIGARNILQAL